MTPESYPASAPDRSFVPASRTADQVVAWIAVALHMLGAMMLLVLSFFSIFLTDSCGTSAGDEPAICDSGYFSRVLVGFWIVLGVSVVLSLVSVTTATVRKTTAWPWAIGSLAIAIVATGVYFFLLLR